MAEGVVRISNDSYDPELLRVIEAWPKISRNGRNHITDIVASEIVGAEAQREYAASYLAYQHRAGTGSSSAEPAKPVCSLCGEVIESTHQCLVHTETRVGIEYNVWTCTKCVEKRMEQSKAAAAKEIRDFHDDSGFWDKSDENPFYKD